MTEPRKTAGEIVVGVDGSESSLDALTWAFASATQSKSSLTVVMAWTWPTVWGRTPTWPPGFDPEAETRRRLSEVVGSVIGEHPTTEVPQIVTQGHAATVLIEAARHADLLVVGRRGHTELLGM